jgi:hypothetical protein
VVQVVVVGLAIASSFSVFIITHQPNVLLKNLSQGVGAQFHPTSSNLTIDEVVIVPHYRGARHLSLKNNTIKHWNKSKKMRAPA